MHALFGNIEAMTLCGGQHHQNDGTKFTTTAAADSSEWKVKKEKKPLLWKTESTTFHLYNKFTTAMMRDEPSSKGRSVWSLFGIRLLLWNISTRGRETVNDTREGLNII